jgi:hypothetical protein
VHDYAKVMPRISTSDKWVAAALVAPIAADIVLSFAADTLFLPLVATRGLYQPRRADVGPYGKVTP